MEEKAFENNFLEDVYATLMETLSRFRYNLDLIYDYLLNLDYQFEDKEKARIYLNGKLEENLKKLDKLLGIRFIPWPLKAFYRIVGGVSFIWSWKVPPLDWYESAVIMDPIVIDGLDDVVAWGEILDWSEYAAGESGIAERILSTDVFHKDNVSDSGYGIEIAKQPCIDSKFPLLNTQYNTNFIEYLRICSEYGWFPGLRNINKPISAFINLLRKDLKRI